MSCAARHKGHQGTAATRALPPGRCVCGVGAAWAAASSAAVSLSPGHMGLSWGWGARPGSRLGEGGGWRGLQAAAAVRRLLRSRAAQLSEVTTGCRGGLAVSDPKSPLNVYVRMGHGPEQRAQEASWAAAGCRGRLGSVQGALLRRDRGWEGLAGAGWG